MRVLSVLFCYSVAGLFFGTFAASGPKFLEMSGFDTGSFGLLLILMTVGALPAMTVLGNLIHRVSAVALPCCLAAFALSAFILGQATDAWGLAIAFLLVGAASGSLDVAMNLRISVLENSEGISLFNRAHAAFPLAVLIAGPVAGAAQDAQVSLAWVYAVLTGLMLLAAGMEALVARTPLVKEDKPPTGKPVPLEPVILCLAAIAACGTFMEMSAQSWSVIFVESVMRTTATVAGFAISAFMLGLSLGRLVAHYLEKRVSAIGIIQMGAVLAALAFPLVAFGGTTSSTLIGLILAGMALGPVEPTAYRLVASRYTQENLGRALSRVTAIAYVGYLTSPVLLGPIAEIAGWPAMWMTVAALAVGIFLLSVTLTRLNSTYSGA